MGNLDDYNERTRQRAMGTPVGPATNAVQTVVDMAADAQQQRPAGTQTRHPEAFRSYRQLLLMIAASVGAMLAGLPMILLEISVFFGAMLSFGGFLFGLINVGRLLKKITGLS